MAIRFSAEVRRDLAQLKQELGAEHVDTLLRTWEADSPELLRELAQSGRLIDQIRGASASLVAAAKLREDKYWSYLSDSELLEFSGADLKLR